MTVILVDISDGKHDLQLSNRAWDCLVTNLSRERVFPSSTLEMLAIPSVGSLDARDCRKLSKVLNKNFLPKVSDQEVLFWDGSIGSVSPRNKGFSMDTPYHLVSHLSKDTLENICKFAQKAHGFMVL